MGTDYPYTDADYPCKKGDILYRISDNCGGCEFETEVCQQRTCKHYHKYVEPMTVEEIIPRHSASGWLYYIKGKEMETDALYGWTAFPTEKEANRRFASFN